MRIILVAAAVLAFAGGASAGPTSFAGINFPSGGAPAPRSSVARPQPVVGSVQRTGRFSHPHTGRTKYTGTAYNPVTGRFGAYTFRR